MLCNFSFELLQFLHVDTKFDNFLLTCAPNSLSQYIALKIHQAKGVWDASSLITLRCFYFCKTFGWFESLILVASHDLWLLQWRRKPNCGSKNETTSEANQPSHVHCTRHAKDLNRGMNILMEQLLLIAMDLSCWDILHFQQRGHSTPKFPISCVQKYCQEVVALYLMFSWLVLE